MKISRKKPSKFYKNIAIIMAAVVATTSVGLNTIANAMDRKKEFIKTDVNYNKEKTKATIKFDLDSIDKEKYELISITSDKENKLIYEKNKVTEENKESKYETEENGTYSFTVKYEENTKEKSITVTEESNTDTVSKEIDEQKEIKSENVSEVKTGKSIVETVEDKKAIENTVVKEEKIIVKVSNIKNSSISEELENNSIKNQMIVNNETPLNLGSSSVNLEGMFDFNGTVSEGSGQNQTNISNSYYTINNNMLSLGKKDSTNINQTIFLKSKYKLDLNRDFEIKGKVKYGAGIDGFTISFHNDGSYISKNVAGSLGVYRDTNYAWTSNKGLSNAIVLEIDNYDNNGVFGDTTGNKHTAILETNSDGDVKNKTYTNMSVSNDIDKFHNISIKWNSKTNEMEFDNGELIKVTKNNFSNISNLKNSGAYLSFSATIYDGKSNVEYVFDDINYTDITPNISTTYEVESKKDYAIAGETVTITHKLWNEAASSAEIEDQLNLKAMKIDDNGNNLEISNIKTGTDLNNLTPAPSGTKFDSNNPLAVKYPANQEKYYVQYDVTIPELEKYGELSKLNCEVLLGQHGMSQTSSSKVVDIKNKPALYTKEGSSQTTGSQIIKVTSPSEVTKALLWNDLYSKIALDNSSEYKINIEDIGTSDMKFEWEYQVNGSKVDSFPEQIEKGNMYTLKLKVTDKSDERLSNEFIRTVIIEEDIVQADNYYIYAEDSTPISETKLVTLTEEEFNNYVKTESKAKAFKVNLQTGLVESKEVEVNLDGWLDSKGSPYRLPGKSEIEFYVKEEPSTKIKVSQEVKENTWSYANDNIPTINGESGFILIPKSIDMVDGSGNEEANLVGSGEISFANYDNATDVKYDISVDKTFDIIKTDDASNKIKVTTTGKTGSWTSTNNKVTFEGFGKIYNENNPIELSFKAAKGETETLQGKWSGEVTFNFDRVS